MLRDLQGSEFIYEQPAPGGVEHTFKHALTQEVAYNSLLIERRKLLHERIGDAIKYLGRAGQQAMQRSAYADAIGSLNAATDLLQRLPDSTERIQRELRLQLTVAPALMVVKGWASPELVRAFARARELCERLGDTPEVFPALWGLWNVHWVRGELRVAYELAEQLLRRAQSAHDPTLLVYAQLALGETSYYMGEQLSARKHLEMAISLYDRERHRPMIFQYYGQDAGVRCLSLIAGCLSHLGYPDQALTRINEAVTLAQGLSHPQSLAFAELWVGAGHLYRREARAAQETAEALIALSAEHRITAFLPFATGPRGWAMAAQGRHEEGIVQIKESLAGIRATGAELSRPIYLCLLAEACREAGRLDDGLSALTEALAAEGEHEERGSDAEIHRLKGELLLKQDDSNAAEAQSCFQRAIEIARKQSAKSLELRATI